MIIAFDLDGTLADLTHRLHFIQQEPKDWPGFFRACVGDKPIEPIIQLARSLMMKTPYHDYDVEIWSGRSEAVRGETVDWLVDNGLDGYSILRMRTIGDHREDCIIKGEWFDALHQSARPTMAFEDRQQVVDMWRSRGVICCQVAPGNF